MTLFGRLLIFFWSLAASLLIILPWPPGWPAAVVSLLFLVVQSKLLGHLFFRRQELVFQFISGLVIVLSYIIIAGSAAFYFFKLDTLSLNLICLGLPWLTLLPLTKSPAKEPDGQSPAWHFWSGGRWGGLLSWVLLVTYLGLAGLLFYRLLLAGSTEALRSPWTVLAPDTFFLYWLASLTLIALNLTSKGYRALVNSLHFFLSLSLVLFIYQLGYGFDPFIHQAAEKIILASGSLTPKPFYYIGQYSLVVWLAHFSQLPVKWLDSWLLPTLASLILPSLIYFAYKYNFKTSEVSLKLLPLTFLLLPYDALIQTTPQGLSFLWSLIIILYSLFYVNRQGLTLRVIFFLALAATVIHPLSGIPLLFFTVMLGLYQRFWKSTALKRYLRLAGYWLLTILAAMVMPLIFIANSLLLRQQPINVNTSEFDGQSFDVFRLTYQRFLRPEDLAYFFSNNLPWLLLFISLASVVFIIYKRKAHFFLHYLVTFLVLLSNYILLKQFIRFNFLTAAEQYIFPDRILTLSFYFLLPFVLLTAYWGFRKLLTLAPLLQLTAWLMLALGLTVSWYLSYPRFDFQVQDKGFSVSRSDQQAAAWIADQTGATDYVVLANQAVSAAALEQYGFKHYYKGHFYYPIPTGEALYQKYLDVVGNFKSTSVVLSEVQQLTGVSRVYVVLNDYWYGFEDIVKRLRQETDKVQVIGDGKIYIFTFELATS